MRIHIVLLMIGTCLLWGCTSRHKQIRVAPVSRPMPSSRAVKTSRVDVLPKKAKKVVVPSTSRKVVQAKAPKARPVSRPVKLVKRSESQPVSRPVVKKPVVKVVRVVKPRLMQSRKRGVRRSSFVYPTLTIPLKARGFKPVFKKYSGPRWSFTWIVLKRLTRYEKMFVRIFRKHRMPPGLMMLAGNESSFLLRLHSKKRAMGMWQIMSHTGRRFGLKITPWIDERRDPAKAARAMIRYMKFLYRRYRSWPLVIAAYNCGEGCVDRIVKRCPKMSFWKMRLVPKCRVPRETRQHVPRFFTLVHYWRNPKKRRMPKRFPTMRWYTATTRGPVSLLAIEKNTGYTVRDLRFYNPELSSWVTPPGRRYRLRVPGRWIRKVRHFLRKKQTSVKLLSVRVSKKASLKKIAAQFGVRTKILKQVNGVWNNKQLRKRRYLIVPKALAKKRSHCRRALWSLSSRSRRFQRRYPPSWLWKNWPNRLARLRRLRLRRLKKSCYKVRRGETLTTVVKKLKFPKKKLLRLNPKVKRAIQGAWLRLAKKAKCPRKKKKRVG